MKDQILSIRSLETLIESLNPDEKDIQEYSMLMSSLNIDEKDISKYFFINKDFYTRNLVKITDSYELLVLCWDVNQFAPIHNHNGQDCWMYLVKGNVEEVLYDQISANGNSFKLKEKKRTLLSGGFYTYINDTIALHRLENVGSSPAVTIHLYSKPILKCNIYNEITGEVEQRKLGYYSKYGKRI